MIIIIQVPIKRILMACPFAPFQELTFQSLLPDFTLTRTFQHLELENLYNFQENCKVNYIDDCIIAPLRAQAFYNPLNDQPKHLIGHRPDIMVKDHFLGDGKQGLIPRNLADNHILRRANKWEKKRPNDQ
jgi:hypothetical protein